MQSYHSSAWYQSPVGPLRLISDGEAIIEISSKGELPDHQAESPLFRESFRQLDEYFSGRRVSFSLPLRLLGTPFQIAVWGELLKIPFGKTVSYRDIALAIGRPRAVRAVGAANGRNPLPIVIPCHRVIGADGSLTGYNRGIEVKRMLLELEGRSMGTPAREVGQL